MNPTRSPAAPPRRSSLARSGNMKEANLDAIRNSAFPAVEDLYDDADELGFYIEEEGPFCWVDESSDLRYLPTFVQRTAEMLSEIAPIPASSIGRSETKAPGDRILKRLTNS